MKLFSFVQRDRFLYASAALVVTARLTVSCSRRVSSFYAFVKAIIYRVVHILLDKTKAALPLVNILWGY